MLKTIVLAAASVAVAGAFAVSAPAPAKAGPFCEKQANGYVAKNPRFQKWCDGRTERAIKRAARNNK